MGEPLHKPLEPHTTGRDHEHTDVPIRPLAIFLAALTASLVLVCIALVGLFNLLESGAEGRDPALAPLAQADSSAPAPNLQVSPREDLQQFRDREAKTLHATQWVNRPAGIVRIPIDRAIQLTAERGFPKWPAADVTATPQPAAAEQPPQEPAAVAPNGAGAPSPAATEEGGQP